MITLAATLAAVAFVSIAALHGYWAMGGVWPGHDPESLERTVVGGPAGSPFPGPAACWAVAALLAAGALTVLAAAGVLALPVPERIARGAAALGALVLLVRGLEGFVDERLRPGTAGSPFARLNVRLYSPLCLVLALLTAASAWR